MQRLTKKQWNYQLKRRFYCHSVRINCSMSKSLQEEAVFRCTRTSCTVLFINVLGFWDANISFIGKTWLVTFSATQNLTPLYIPIVSGVKCPLLFPPCTLAPLTLYCILEKSRRFPVKIPLTWPNKVRRLMKKWWEWCFNIYGTPAWV